MPSPFPGMDPYLEGSAWTGVYAALSVEIARQLAPLLQPRYVARTNERFVMTWMEPEEGVSVSTASIHTDAFVTDSEMATGSTAGVAVVSPPLRVPTIIPESVRLLTVEIRDTAHQQVVTAIEVLSPTNKRGEGRQEYPTKRRRMLRSSAHLMEIDLLRTGQRVPMREPLPPHPYFVLLSRADLRPLTDVWPVALSQSLPTVPIPLLPGDGEVPLDLQRALASVYDTFRYDLTLHYTRPPEVPLGPPEAAWAREQLGLPRPSRGER